MASSVEPTAQDACTSRARTTNRRHPALLLAATLAACGLAAEPALAQDEAPVAAFVISPPAPLTLDSVELRSTSTGAITATTWDLDDDGACDDASGSVAARSFAVRGTYRVRVCVSGPSGEASQLRNVVVANRPPQPAFGPVGDAPRAGEQVVFLASASDPDGTVTAYAWDFNGDGLYDDGAGIAATFAYLDPGTYAVGLQVTDDAGEHAAATQTVTVGPSIMWPLPRVRLLSRVNARSLSVRWLHVQAPEGAVIDVRCLGRGCGRRHEVRAAPAVAADAGPATLRFGRFERRLRAGTVLEIRATRRGAIGLFTAFRVRGGQPPERTDLCLAPGSDAPQPCIGL